MRINLRKAIAVPVLMMTFGLTTLSVSAAPMDTTLEKDLVRICEALKSDSKLQLHRAVKRSRLSFKQINQGLVCNGDSAQDFALSHDAQQTADLLARKSKLNTEVLTARRFE
ncbi:DUF3718 domain-containing protein [Alteromonas facilis]|uniref:DUF3718 domain-containing protein n=1 Tax=Alteromonas facilis TaxID=2048004 RepID=UPI000C283789|nr:DUF3718 domain-containing protein [Alteromonas facilis]